MNAFDDSHAVMEVPDADGSFYPFHAAGITMAGETCFLLPLEQERTEGGRGLVRALWFDHPVYLWIGDRRYTLRPWRCHIVGEVFSRFYRHAKANDPEREVACVWELRITDCEAPDSAPPAPMALHLTGRPERHLDHPSLHQHHLTNG